MLYDPYPHELNYISNYLDDYFPWMDDYRPKSDEIKDRFFFKRAPINRPYGYTGKVNLGELSQNSINMDCSGWIEYCEFEGNECKRYILR